MDEKKHGSFSSGFVWGLIVGIILSVLIGTKRGREFLKELSERGLSAVEDFLQEQESVLEEEVVEMGEQDAGEVGATEEKLEESVNVPPESKAEKPATNGSSKKRVFKGIKRK